MFLLALYDFLSKCKLYFFFSCFSEEAKMNVSHCKGSQSEHRIDDLMSSPGKRYLIQRPVSSAFKYVDHMVRYAKPVDPWEARKA